MNSGFKNIHLDFREKLLISSNSMYHECLIHLNTPEETVQCYLCRYITKFHLPASVSTVERVVQTAIIVVA